jgi:hypothetical protein
LGGSRPEGFVHSTLLGGGPRHLEECFPALEASPRSNGIEDKPIRIGVRGWTTLPTFLMVATFSLSWFALAIGKTFESGLRMAVTISKTMRAVGRCRTLAGQFAQDEGVRFLPEFRPINTQHEYGDAELPKAMTWLWRGYDPAKTSQEFIIDPEENTKPYFRVGIVNR